MAELLTVEEAAHFLRLKRTEVLRLVSRGELSGKKYGGQWRFREQDIQETLHRRKQEKAIRSLPGQFKFYSELLKESDSFLQGKRKIGLEKRLVFATLHYFVKSRKLVKAIHWLCANGLASEAKILLRSLVEATLLLNYLAGNPSDVTRAEDCLIRQVLAEKKRLNELQKLKFYPRRMPKNVVTNLTNAKKRYAEAIARIRSRSPVFQGMPEKQLVDKTELTFQRVRSVLSKEEPFLKAKKNLLEEWYSTVVRDCSEAVHCNDFQAHITLQDSGAGEVLLKSQPRWTHLVLRASANAFVESMRCTNAILGFGKERVVQRLARRYRSAFPDRLGGYSGAVKVGNQGTVLIFDGSPA